MSKVIYSMGVSLDGYIAGRDGEIDWSAPNEELHWFHNSRRARELGLHLSGRRFYEEMLPWEKADHRSLGPEYVEFARIWKALPKVVFSTTLETVEGNATLATDDLADEVAKLNQQPGQDVSVSGAGLASSVIKLDLIDGRLAPASSTSATSARRSAPTTGWTGSPAPARRVLGPRPTWSTSRAWALTRALGS